MLSAMREYYEQRAPEYDDWWEGTGRFAVHACDWFVAVLA
jgi:hypothetical protein